MLYKYLPPTREDFFSKLTIRFTQPFFFNDPFEGRPHIVYDYNKEQSLKSLEWTAKEDKWPDDMYQYMREKCENGEFDKEWPNVMKILTEIMVSTTVCLSLTETHDNLLMWAHYSLNHEGFVIGFDENHPFIKGQGNGIYKLTKISYTADRPNVGISKLTLIDTYFTKSNEWAYEKEWRIFEEARNADRIIDGTICLYNVPPDSITEVILGSRMDTKIKESILKSISENKSLNHITTKQAEIDENFYKLNIENLEANKQFQLEPIRKAHTNP